MKSTRLKCISDVTRTKRPLGAVGKLKGHIHSSEPIWFIFPEKMLSPYVDMKDATFLILKAPTQTPELLVLGFCSHP